MKKVYEKPQVYMERFELSQSIAACDYKLNAGNIAECNIEADRYVDDYGDFTGGFTADGHCSKDVSVYCYTDGSGLMPAVFQS